MFFSFVFLANLSATANCFGREKKLVSAAASRLKWHSSFRPFHIVACIAQEVAYGELNRAQRPFPSQPILYRIGEIQKTECCLRLRSIKMVNFHFRFLSSVFVMENLQILIEFVLDNFMRFSLTPIQNEKWTLLLRFFCVNPVESEFKFKSESDEITITKSSKFDYFPFLYSLAPSRSPNGFRFERKVNKFSH